MKVTNWRRNLAASLVAVGLLTPCAAWAANLNENLVINPGFENVDVGITCCYLSAATKLNSWADGSMTGFAYNNELPELNGSGDLGWDDGGPLAGGGLYFFGPASGNDRCGLPVGHQPGRSVPEPQCVDRTDRYADCFRRGRGRAERVLYQLQWPR